MGQIEQMKMVQMAAGLAPLNASKPMVNQARGETGRNRLMMGLNMREKKFKTPDDEPGRDAHQRRQAKTQSNTLQGHQHIPAHTLVVGSVAVKGVGKHLDRLCARVQGAGDAAFGGNGDQSPQAQQQGKADQGRQDRHPQVGGVLSRHDRRDVGAANLGLCRFGLSGPGGVKYCADHGSS